MHTGEHTNVGISFALDEHAMDSSTATDPAAAHDIARALDGLSSSSWLRRRLWSPAGLAIVLCLPMVLLVVNTVVLMPSKFLLGEECAAATSNDQLRQRRLGIDASLKFAALLVTFLLLRSMVASKGIFLSKHHGTMLECLLRGAPQGAVMVSYKWSRKDSATATLIAAAFSNDTCWLDTLNLLPGSSIEDVCTAAAEEACVAFILLSPGYLKSRNCLLELTTFDPRLLDVLTRRGVLSRSEIDLDPTKLSEKPLTDGAKHNSTQLIVIVSQVCVHTRMSC